jgi:hypothetical protein
MASMVAQTVEQELCLVIQADACRKPPGFSRARSALSVCAMWATTGG